MLDLCRAGYMGAIISSAAAFLGADFLTDLRAALRVDFLADDVRAALRVDLRAALRAVLREDLRAALRVDLRAALRDDFRATLRVDLRAALRVDLRAPLRVDLRAVLRVDLRAVLRVDLRVDLRVALRVDLRVALRVDFLAVLFLVAFFTAMFPPPFAASSCQCRHIRKIAQDPLEANGALADGGRPRIGSNRSNLSRGSTRIAHGRACRNEAGAAG